MQEKITYLWLTASDEAVLAWLEEALAHAFEQGQERIAEYLQTVLEEVVFEIVLSVR